jgi:hypothetical protein
MGILIRRLHARARRIAGLVRTANIVSIVPKKAVLVVFAANSLLLLSSCGFAYKPVIAHTNKNEMVYTIPLESHSLDISMGVDKKNKDDAEFGVRLKIAGSRAGHNITIDTLRLYLTGARSNNQPYDFKQAVIGKEGNWGVVWGTVYTEPVITALDLADGTWYLNYRFIHLTKKDIHHRMHLHIDADITEDGRSTTIKQSLDFKRYFWLDIAGN